MKALGVYFKAECSHKNVINNINIYFYKVGF